MTNTKHDQTGSTEPNNGANASQATDAAAQQGTGKAASSAHVAADSARQQAASAAWQQALARAAGAVRAQGSAAAQASEETAEAKQAQVPEEAEAHRVRASEEATDTQRAHHTTEQRAARAAQHPEEGAQRAQAPHMRQQAPRGTQRQVPHMRRQKAAHDGPHQTAHQRQQAPHAAHPQSAGATHPQGAGAPHTQNRRGARPHGSGAAPHATGNAGTPHVAGHPGAPHTGSPRPNTVHPQTNPHRAQPTRPATLGYVTATDGHGHRPGYGGARPLAAAAAALACIGLVVLAGCWFFMWRDVTITVNGEPVTAKVSAPLSEVLDGNDQFGAKPGRLLSVTGEVLSKDGGNACTVSRGEQELSANEISQARVQDGDEFSVTDGTDKEEPSTEETVEVAPKIDKKEGGAIQYVSQWGKSGKKRVKKGKTSGKTVDINYEKLDQYGRITGTVRYQGRNINLEQIQDGCAWFYRYFARDLTPDLRIQYNAAEVTARKERVGLWRDPHPMNPYDFRRSKR